MSDEQEPKIIIVAGDILEGHCLVGPFSDYPSAEDFFKNNMDYESVLFIELLSPQEYIEMTPSLH
ncbi:MAG: hypothetical protein E6Q97_37005 [Desulfurellales bacterium]|nr:MAG: hypothetical protein E6Q97_37005 [Desulfurellales bacterium]